MIKNTGGLPLIRLNTLQRSMSSIHLMSDLHLGSANCDVALIKEELNAAQSYGSRIIIGGDLLDLVLPGDRKHRYLPASLAPRLQGRNDVLNGCMDWLEELLSPYAKLIDVIGCGNHETYIEKEASFDPIEEIIRRLNKAGGCVHHGSYTSMIQYRLPKRESYTIWYHHGSGKTTKTYLALKSLMEQVGVFEADLYWSGHSHTRASCTETRIKGGPKGLITRDVKCVITGSYLTTYADQSEHSLAGRGRRSNYAADCAMRPHGLGGADVFFTFDGLGYPNKVEVIQ